MRWRYSSHLNQQHWTLGHETRASQPWCWTKEARLRDSTPMKSSRTSKLISGEKKNQNSGYLRWMGSWLRRGMKEPSGRWNYHNRAVNYTGISICQNYTANCWGWVMGTWGFTILLFCLLCTRLKRSNVFFKDYRSLKKNSNLNPLSTT